LNFGKRLKELREAKGLRQEDIGKKINVGKSAVSQWENNIRTPDAYVILQLADFFNVTTDYMLGRTDDPRPFSKDTIAEPDSNDPVDKLPEQAKRSLEEFKEYIIHKYSKKRSSRS